MTAFVLAVLAARLIPFIVVIVLLIAILIFVNSLP